MKTLLYSMLFMVCLVLFAFKANILPNPDVFGIKEIEKTLAKINDTLYASKYEVSNMQYLAFEKDLKDNNKVDLLKIIQVDSLNWRDKLMYNEPYVQYYYRHPAYYEFPVVNISYEAANLFCEWLTNTYNSAPKKMFKKVLFRLPTESEWETAARAGWKTPYAWGDRLVVNDRKMCNYYSIGDENIKFDTLKKVYYLDFQVTTKNLNDAGFITAPVLSYSPNDLGLFNVCGNVAEMTNIKGLSCGGSWKSAGGDVMVTSRANYSGTANDVGFRYFMVVLEK